jgi:hypothetical protein
VVAMPIATKANSPPGPNLGSCAPLPSWTAKQPASFSSLAVRRPSAATTFRDQAGNIFTSNSDLWIDGGTLAATIDDVRIYNRALTAAEVKQLYKLGNVRVTQ